MSFNFVRIYATLELNDNITDPFAFFSIREMLQEAFHRLMGCGPRSCDSCTNIKCPGSLAFSQTLSPDPAAVRRYQKPSFPFVFDIPLLPALPNRGTLCTLSLTLMGEAVNHCQTYLSALRLMFGSGNQGCLPAQVVRFEAAGYGTERYPLAENSMDGLVVLSDEGLLGSRVYDPSEIPIEFLTPLRLLQEGKPARNLPPSLLLRSLMRRITSLAYYYGAVELDADFKWLTQQADNVSWKKTSIRWVNRSNSLSGLIGNGVLSGDLSDFHYFLALGEYFHVGKGAPYGLGKFILQE